MTIANLNTRAIDDLHTWIREVIIFGQDHEPMPASVLAAKMFEEGGEFSTAALWHDGWCNHKELDEPIEGEMADVFMLLLATYGRLFPDLPSDVLLENILVAFDRKFAKYKNVISKNHPKRRDSANVPA